MFKIPHVSGSLLHFLQYVLNIVRRDSVMVRELDMLINWSQAVFFLLTITKTFVNANYLFSLTKTKTKLKRNY